MVILRVLQANVLKNHYSEHWLSKVLKTLEEHLCRCRYRGNLNTDLNIISRNISSFSMQG